jgi:carbon-monoxide dehydrogenase large subunit
MRTVNSFISSPVERREDLRFLRRRGEFVDDVTRNGVLHAAILRSSVAHGRLRSVDATAALALPGVHSVITAKDLLASNDIGNRVPRVPMRLQPLPDFLPFGQPVIAESKVRYVGEADRAGARRHRRSRGGCARPDRGRHRGVASRCRPRCIGE